MIFMHHHFNKTVNKSQCTSRLMWDWAQTCICSGENLWFQKLKLKCFPEGGSTSSSSDLVDLSQRWSKTHIVHIQVKYKSISRGQSSSCLPSKLTQTCVKKLDYIYCITSTNCSPVYSSYWPVQRNVWYRMSYCVILIQNISLNSSKFTLQKPMISKSCRPESCWSIILAQGIS